MTEIDELILRRLKENTIFLVPKKNIVYSRKGPAGKIVPWRKIYIALNPKGYFLFSVPGDMRLFGDSDVAYGHFRRYEKVELIQS